MAQIASAVGDGAPNLPVDVRAVQMLLNRFEGPSARLLEVDGAMGPLTLGAIRKFLAVRMPAEPAVIRPGSQALVALNAGDTDRIAWGGKVDALFKAKVTEVALALEVSVDFLMAAMAFESGETFSPSIRNAAGSGATGLIQFMPATATALGTSTEKLAAMSATGQLDFVQLYFRPRRGKLHTLEDVYMAILFPAAIGKGADFVLFRRGTPAYDQNRGLDADHDGQITVGEATAKVRQKYTKGLTEGLLA